MTLSLYWNWKNPAESSQLKKQIALIATQEIDQFLPSVQSALKALRPKYFNHLYW